MKTFTTVWNKDADDTMHRMPMDGYSDGKGTFSGILTHGVTDITRKTVTLSDGNKWTVIRLH